MDQLTFERLQRIFLASQVVWERMQSVAMCGPEWKRLARKHALLRQRYGEVREMSGPRTIH